MPPNKRVGKPSKSTGKKKNKRSHAELVQDDDLFSFGLDVDDDDGDDDKPVDDSLDLPLLDPSDLNPLSSHATQLHSDLHTHPHISKHGNKLKLKLGKSHSSQLDPHNTPHYLHNTAAAAASLAFTYHPASLLALLPKSTNTLDGEELKALAKDLHALQRESKVRALLIEGELRKLYEASGSGGGGDGAGGGIEGEEYYQNAIKWLHGIDVSDDVLGSDESASSAMVEQRRKKQGGGKKGDDDDDADGTKRKNKKKRNSQPAAADGDNEEDGEVDSGDESKPKKAMTAKEKQTALREWWEAVDGWMAFPTIEQCDSVRETEWRGLEIGPPSSYWMKEGKERDWREEREREREKERDKERERERERLEQVKDPKKRKKEKKREKERREKERERDKNRDAKKLAEANRLSLFVIEDAGVRRGVVEMESTLAGINGSAGAGGGGGAGGGLVSRVMGIFVEQVGKVVPYFNPGVKGKAAGSASKKQKKDNKAQRSSITPPQFTLEERLRMELKSVGLLSGADVDLVADHAHRADDELCAALRSHSTSLSQAVASNNTVRRMLHPLSLRLVDHTQRLQLLYEAEASLSKSYKKKKLSDNKCKEVVEQYVTQLQRLGSRRRITGFIPHPHDTKGVPRVIADSVLSHPSYRDVLMADELPPLQGGGGGGGGHYYGGRYGKGGAGLMPPSTLPSLMHLSSAAYSPGGSSHGGYFASSPLPSFSSHNSPLHLSPSGSPVRSADVGEDGGGGGGGGNGGPSTPQPLELYSPNNISIGHIGLGGTLAQDANGDRTFEF